MKRNSLAEGERSYLHVIKIIILRTNTNGGESFHCVDDGLLRLLVVLIQMAHLWRCFLANNNTSIDIFD